MIRVSDGEYKYLQWWETSSFFFFFFRSRLVLMCLRDQSTVMNIRKSYLRTAGWKIKWERIIAIIDSCSCEKKAWKNSGLVVRDSNRPGPLRYQCSALPIKLTSQLRVIRMYKCSVKSAASSFATCLECPSLPARGLNNHRRPRRGMCHWMNILISTWTN